jgi:DNA-directed RNA polymerase specialized sigma24 family protein
MAPEPDPLLAMAPDHPRLLRLARRLLGDPDAAQDAVAHAFARAPAERRRGARLGFLRRACWPHDRRC